MVMMVGGRHMGLYGLLLALLGPHTQLYQNILAQAGSMLFVRFGDSSMNMREGYC